ncbi:MAG: S8 family peptidase [Caldilineaceae bacterium]|nr:S8 family peptidase [Caldilineaceae bacterium]
MERKRIELQDNSLGIQPEQVLVLETVGSIEDFFKAIGHVEGLEWLGEGELDDISPDHGFENSKNSDSILRGQLFLVMTDQRALQELRSLFTQWRSAPNQSFRRGLAPLKKAFELLYDIRPWSAEDRIRETGIMEDLEARLQDGQEVIPFEVELWYRQRPQQREEAAAHLRALIASMGGEITQRCALDDIAYHAILGQAPRDHVLDIVRRRDAPEDVELLGFDGIKLLRPVGQCTVGPFDSSTETDALPDAPLPGVPSGAPLVALFDGVPLAGHERLEDWVKVHDPDGYEGSYQAHERVHGTSMASLICHGDLEEGQEPIGRPLYVRPILKPRRFDDGKFEETVPDDVLTVDLVHRAVRRLYEPENGEPPAAPSVRVINLSVGDSARPFFREMSPWARLIDWLAWEYNLLFVVSAGNHGQPIELEVPRSELWNLSNEEREGAVLQAIAADGRNRRLLSPAETLNGLTVAAIHEDCSTPAASAHLIDPFVSTKLPSVYSAQGPGYRRAVKPDIFLPGGMQFTTEKLGSSHAKATLRLNESNRPPGQSVAAPGREGLLDQRMHTRGTSNAAALATRGASFIFDMIEQLRGQADTEIPEEYDVVLTKALLVHGATWATADIPFREVIERTQNGTATRADFDRFLGYGSADLHKVLACDEQRVTVLGFGELSDGQGAEFSFPLPPSLSGVTDARRLTVSLAWLTPVQCTNQKYRVAHVWFNPPRWNRIDERGINAVRTASQRGTVQHEVFEDSRAIPFEDGENLVIKVSCRKDAAAFSGPIRYGLAVTLEVKEGVDISIPIYQEVRERLGVRIAV